MGRCLTHDGKAVDNQTIQYEYTFKVVSGERCEVRYGPDSDTKKVTRSGLPMVTSMRLTTAGNQIITRSSRSVKSESVFDAQHSLGITVPIIAKLLSNIPPQLQVLVNLAFNTHF